MKSKKLTKLMKIQAVVFAAVFAAGACSVGAFAYNCSRVRSDVLRMHVIANSDCGADQQLKLMVRDAVLEAAAREVIERAGYDYPVSVNVVNEYFATRCYGSLTMPAGRYTAVKVVIGEGAGRNWWCVMFPPLCLPAAQDRGGNLDAFFDDGELKVVESSGRYEPRFKIVEIIEKLKEKTSFEN